MSKLRQFSGFIAGMAFVADLITIASFIYGAFFRDAALSGEGVKSHVALIVVIFIFAVLLARYARSEAKGLDWVWSLFAWLYVLYGAVILAFVVYEGMYFQAITWEWLAVNLTLVTLTAGLGFIVMALVSKKKLVHFAAPFMVVALEHIGLWVVKVVRGKLFLFDAQFGYETLLFLYSGALIAALLGLGRQQAQ
ncbi:MAG: hypothetical protein SX243_01615 [Acidobacteriota bacterium]|nr:hypothetical protein [Acidobacteriota bacterium]